MLPNGEIKISDLSPADLRNLIQTGEGAYLEFKKTIPSPNKIAREIAAFANTNGGTLLIGVDDHKNITGISSYFEEEFDLHKAASDLREPAVPLQIELIHCGPYDVMIVKIEEAEKKPVYLKNEIIRLSFYWDNVKITFPLETAAAVISEIRSKF